MCSLPPCAPDGGRHFNCCRYWGWGASRRLYLSPWFSNMKTFWLARSWVSARPPQRRPLLTDPKDDLVLELAAAPRSTRIVTYNVKDFEGGERFGVRVVRPAELLAELGIEL